MNVYVNSPAWMRPNVPQKEVPVGDIVVKGQKKQITELREYVTEFVSEFKTPIYAITDGKAARDADEFAPDLWYMIETMVPWARCVIGPKITLKDPFGKVSEVPCMTADTYEKVAGMGAIPRITTIAISSALEREAAIKAALGAAWAELESVAATPEVYTKGWADEITASLLEVQAPVIAEGYRSDAEQRKAAFVAYAMNAMHGALRIEDASLPFCYQVFQDAEDGTLGERLGPHRIGY